MIESKLYNAVQKLPEPTSSFSRIEERAHRDQKKSVFNFRYYRRVAAMLVCAVLLMGSTVVAATTEVDYSAWATHSVSFSDVEKKTEIVGVVLPEALDDSPFYNITTMYVVPEGTTYLDALSNPSYPWYSVDYGVQDVIRVYDSDEPGSGYSESGVVYDEYSVSFGSTDNELFRYVFSLDENGTRVYENILPGSYRTEVYKSLTMQIMTDVQYEDDQDRKVFVYHHRVVWIDEQNHAVFSLRKSFYAEEDAADRLPAEMIEFAKEIIDMNVSR